MKAPARHPPRGIRRTLALRPLVDDSRRAPSPVVKACLEDLRQAQSHLQAAASRLRGVATAIEAIRPDIANGILYDANEIQVLARSLDADVLALRDLADPRRGVR